MSISFPTQGHYVVYICPDVIFQILPPCSRPMTSHHMTSHMMWCHRPRTWWKDLEDDIRAYVYNIVALSRKWDRHDVMDIRTLTIFLFFSFLLFFLILLFLFFILFSWKDDEEGTWQGSHMTCHMLWRHKPRTGWKGLEDNVRAHGIHMVALSRT